MSPRKARANEVERTPILRTILFYSGHLQHVREWPDVERKYMNSDNWQGPTQRVRVKNLVKWDRGWWHKYTKQARVLRYKSWSRTRDKPEEPVCWSGHWAVKNTKNTKKQAKMTQHWYLSETHSKAHLFHVLNTEVTWLNNNSTNALDCVANAEINIAV